MSASRRLLLGSTLAAATALLAAEPLNIKPGHWDMKTTMTMAGAPLYVEGMSDAQRAEYAKSWAKEVGKPQVDNDDECISAKDIREMEFLGGLKDDAKACKQSLTRQTATAVAGTMDCKSAKTTTRTEIEFIADSPMSFHGSMKSTTQSPNGTTTMTIATTAKWLAASCPDGDDDDDDDEA